MHSSKKLLIEGYEVLGIDNMNDYYDVELKINRLKKISKFSNFKFLKLDISNKESLHKAFNNFKPMKVLNLAAQAGVRYSLKNPQAYVDNNISGFLNILECCVEFNVKGLVYASSSSVYGNNNKLPFSPNDQTSKPISMYAVSKTSNELMAYAYNSLYGLNLTGLRFFTVYGPWGRPDMAMSIFADKITKGGRISLFNYGEMVRDFTYIDDIIDGIVKSIQKNYKFEIFNLGNSRQEKLVDLIKIIENKIGKKANIKLKEIQKGDVVNTYADIDYSREKLGFDPVIDISKGVPTFLDWWVSYHKKNKKI